MKRKPKRTIVEAECPLFNRNASGAAITLLLTVAFCLAAANAEVSWQRKSSSTGDMPTPNDGKQQTCCLILDIDKDGIDDFVVGERTQTPSVVWYKYNGKGWDKFVIDDTRKNPEAGGDYCDIDRDGDLDVILGQDYSGNAIWWWENPYPDFSKPWTCRHIKNSGSNKHHDQTVGDYCDVDRDGDLDVILGQDYSGNAIWWWENPYPDFSKPWTCRHIKNSSGKKHHDQTVGDFDGDGQVEFVSWNQGGKKLLFFEIPADPKSTGPWPSATIYEWSSGNEREGFPSIPVDIDLDGKVDLVGGGRWFKHVGGNEFRENVIDAEMAFTQCAAGQLIKGGRPEVVFSPGDMDGQARWYEWTADGWKMHVLREVIHGHTCEIRDIDGDGNLDIFIGEMGNPGAGENARIYIWYGDGKGHFKETVASHGQGIHEGKLGDLDGDGDLDILLKPYNHKTPRMDILLNGGGNVVGSGAEEDGWQVLFDGSNLSKWQNDSGGKPNPGWVIEDSVLTMKPKAGMIWTKERFGDFILDLEFKTEGNSGIFFRTDNPKDCVQTGIEIQVYKRVEKPSRHSCGAVYDALAPSREMTKNGQWNHITITAKNNKIGIVLNGEQIIDMDLNQWTEPQKNPDNSKNKFRTALKDFKREGHIGFQDHNANVWFRNVRIRQL